MPTPRFELAIGVSDSVNVLFYTPTFPYAPGSVAVFLNGQLKRADFMDGWVESNPAVGEVTLLLPPLAGVPPDVVQIFYLDTSVSPQPTPETEITRLHAVVLDTVDVLSARLQEMQPLQGSISVC